MLCNSANGLNLSLYMQAKSFPRPPVFAFWVSEFKTLSHVTTSTKKGSSADGTRHVASSLAYWYLHRMRLCSMYL